MHILTVFINYSYTTTKMNSCEGPYSLQDLQKKRNSQKKNYFEYTHLMNYRVSHKVHRYCTYKNDIRISKRAQLPQNKNKTSPFLWKNNLYLHCIALLTTVTKFRYILLSG